MDWQQQLYILAVVGLAGVVGAIIGLERELARKPAGLRTHIFVCAAASLLMLLGNVVAEQFREEMQAGYFGGDPIRVIQAIVIGINFLGAGTIIHQGGDQVEGLTTAASVFFTAGLGIAVALHQFIVAIVAAVGAVLVLRMIGWVEWGISKRPVRDT